MAIKIDLNKQQRNYVYLLWGVKQNTLTNIYEYAFGAVKSCEQSDDGDYFIVIYHEGLEP